METLEALAEECIGRHGKEVLEGMIGRLLLVTAFLSAAWLDPWSLGQAGAESG